MADTLDIPKSLKKPRPYRVDDLVRVVNPRFVTRCGYPKTVADYLHLVYAHDESLNTLLHAMQGKAQAPLKVRLQVDRNDPRYKPTRLEWELAYVLAKADRFGGPVRSLHWVEHPSHKDREVTVSGVRTVQTGTYSSGYCHYNEWTGDYDSEATGLEDRKTYRLVKLHLGAPHEVGHIWAGQGLETTVDNLELVRAAQ